MRVWPLAMAIGLGCGSSGARHDAAPTDLTGPPSDAFPSPADGATSDFAADGGLAVAPHGTQLLASSGNVWLRGVTDDGLAIYYDPLSGDISALPIAGGPPSLITTLPGHFTPDIQIAGPAVAIATVGIQGTSALWTAAHGGMVLSTSGDGDVAVSGDGQYVLYFDGVGTDDVSLFAARTDGTDRSRLAYVRFPNPFEPNGCPGFQMGFAGDHAIAAFCEPKADGLPHQLQVTSWKGPTWSKTLHVPEDREVGQDYATDLNATQVLVRTASGLQVYPIEGGTPTTIDTGGFFGVFSRDGKTVLYTTTTGQLRRAAVASPTPLTLLDSGAAVLLAISPDDRLALVSSSASDNSALLRMASTTTPGAPLFQSKGPVRSSDVLFTADSKHAVYLMFDGGPMSPGVPRLYAVSSAGAGTPRPLTTDGGLQWVRAAGGAKLIFEETQNSPDGLASFSIKTVDLAQGAAPATLVTDVGEAFLSATNDQVVYRWHFHAGPQAGIWVTPVP